MSEAIQKIESILKSEYSTQGFVEFSNEIFDSLKIVAPDKFHKEYSNFSSHIEGYIHVGDYVSSDNRKIAVFSVKLKTATYVENSRSTQRSYVRRLIDAGNCDAAIVSFYSTGETKWRLSFVRLDYEMKFDNGKFKTTENLTPAKRYSFLVGKDEPCHTAISRFHNFIIDKNYNPSLDEIEEAFSVENVTKEFFDLYCEKFYQLQAYLETNQDFIYESRKCGFTSEQFAKKLMGQIVFLYFLQKKGWLGVSVWPSSITEKEYKNVYYTSGAQGRIIKEHFPKIYVKVADDEYRLNSRVFETISDDDEEVIANHMPRVKTWGDGSKKFLRTIYDWAQKRGGHFYEEYLEPLFYNSLNRNRGQFGYCPELHCRVPFLSGGLFDPIENYDWKSNYFDIPDDMFSNKKNENDRGGTGILDIFDRYNFTISEDEPMEREVAIDPEMLGKVFENLLEVKDRKSKGAFYTSREIVHYMCQESLINYLVRKTGAEEDDIRDFILYGDFMKDEDTSKEKREGNGGMYISEKLFKIDESGNIVANKLKEIDDALATVRVADPAVGSGAFPLGMMNEIVRARQNITSYLAIGMNSFDKRFLLRNERSSYYLKRHTIKNSIFAVDIEPSAVDIAQLRLWLSLVIDDEINPNAQNDLEGHRNPLPLPNLECNILCGNSLVDEFMGVKLVKGSDIIGTMHEGVQMYVGRNRFETVLQKLMDEQDRLFCCDDTVKKEELKNNIQSYKDIITKEQLRWATPEVQAAYEEVKKKSSKPFILWQIDFSRVFRDNGGFDIVIGNPPYVGEKGHKEMFQEIARTELGKKYYYGKVDLFYFFFHKSLDLLRERGINALITTNYYITAQGAIKLRTDFFNRATILKMIDFNEYKLFQSALGQHNMITILEKGKLSQNVETAITSRKGNSNQDVLVRILQWNDAETEYFAFSQEQLYEGNQLYIRLQGVGNDDNPLESVLGKMKESPYQLGELCAVNIGMRTGADKLSEAYISKYNIKLPKNTGIYVITSDELDEMNLTDNEKRLILPWFKNSDIAKYSCKTNNDLWLIDLSVTKHESIDFVSIPNILNHISRFKAVLENRKSNDNGLQSVIKRGLWWAFTMRQIDFSAPKIVSPQRSKFNTFGYNEVPWYASMDVYFITALPKSKVELKYVLALLNSKLMFVWLYNKGKRKGNTLELYQKPLSEVPIVIADNKTRQKIISYVDRIISNDQNSTEVKDKIDRLIYEVYALSDEEIRIVENYMIQFND